MMAIRASTINGEIQEFPPTYYFPCSQVHPQGEAVIRDYDDNTCIVARKVYLVEYGGNVFGTVQFDTYEEFEDYKSQSCTCCGGGCVVIIGGCVLLYNGCDLTYNKNILSN